MTEQAPQSLVAVPQDTRRELTVADLQHQQSLIQQVLREVMVKDHHYGLPFTSASDGKPPRPVLLKPGAEKLCSLFRLAPIYVTEQHDLPGGHREFLTTCRLEHVGSGTVVGTGVGSCSSMESKYRWRLASRACPECGAEAIRKSRDGGFFCGSKQGGCGSAFDGDDQRILAQKLGRTENPDIADQLNTCLKMACKRALVAAVLTATACSDMFVHSEDEDGDDDGSPRQGNPSRGAGAAAGSRPHASRGPAANGASERQQAAPLLTDAEVQQLHEAMAKATRLADLRAAAEQAGRAPAAAKKSLRDTYQNHAGRLEAQAKVAREIRALVEQGKADPRDVLSLAFGLGIDCSGMDDLEALVIVDLQHLREALLEQVAESPLPPEKASAD